MNLFRAILSLALLGSAMAETGPRVFTNTEGKRIVAEVVGADDRRVTLKLEGGRIVNIPLASLSTEDQSYVAKWASEKLPKLTIAPDFVRGNRNQDSNGGKGKEGQQVQVLNMTVEIRNEEKSKALEECEARYLLVGRSLEDRGIYKVLAVQTADFSLEPGKEVTLPFTEVQNHYEDSSKRARGHRCLGYILQIQRKSDGREVSLMSDTPALEKAAAQIVALPNGTEMDETFTPLQKDRKGKKGPKDGPIIVR